MLLLISSKAQDEVQTHKSRSLKVEIDSTIVKYEETINKYDKTINKMDSLIKAKEDERNPR